MVLNYRTPMVLVGATLAVMASFTKGLGQDPVAQRASLGVIISCDCTVNANPSAAKPWRFRSPLVVTSVIDRGPADGVLLNGDSIMSIDGVAVTTVDGASRLASARPGDRLNLAIRRGGSSRIVQIKATPLRSDDRSLIGNYAPRVLAGATRQATSSTRPKPVPVPPYLETKGWMGFALACSGCGWAQERGNTSPYWESSDAPIVYAVQPRSPADRAGLRVNDVITHVNEVVITDKVAGRALGGIQPGETLTLTIRRGDRSSIMRLVAGVRPTIIEAQQASRYNGQLGFTIVSVYGSDPVDVAVSNRTKEMVITVGRTVVKLRTR